MNSDLLSKSSHWKGETSSGNVFPLARPHMHLQDSHCGRMDILQSGSVLLPEHIATKKEFQNIQQSP